MRKYMECDGIRFCLDEKTGYYLSSRNIGSRRVRLHVYVWEKVNGPVPNGYVVHHIDQNKANNTLANLLCEPVGQHAKFHSNQRFEDVTYLTKQRVHLDAIRDTTKEWHASDAGREWHRQHAREVAITQAQCAVTLSCAYCGKVYQTLAHRNGYSKFCSNNCKMSARRKSGVDNELRVCEQCSITFVTNKYSKVRFCSGRCSAKHREAQNRGVANANKVH